MRRAVRFEVARDVDAEALHEYLHSRGFTVRLARANGHIDVDVLAADEEPGRLPADVRGAVATWLARHEPVLVPTRLDDDAFALAPPGE